MIGGGVGWDAFAERHLRDVLRAYQRVEVTVARGADAPVATAHVHTPYMMQTVSIVADERALARLKPRHRERLRRAKEARDRARPEVRAYLQEQFHEADGHERDVAKGRASSEDVRALLQGAVDRRLVSPGGRRLHPDGKDLRAWLRRFGVGVDCSGFAQHALDSLVSASYAADGRTPDEEDDTGFVRAGWVYRQVSAPSLEGASRFRPVATPAEARPGDVLVSASHIRVVVRAAVPGSGLILDLAESTSASGVPCGLAAEEADIGPRLIQVMYTEPERPVEEQMPLLRRPEDDAFEAEAQERAYVIGRFRALDRARAAYRGRAAAGASAPDR